MKKSQTVAIGFAVMLVILIVFIQVFTSEFQRSFPESKEFELLQDEAGRIGNILSGPSIPRIWTDFADVRKMGLMKEGVIERGTLQKLYNFPYPKTKVLLGTSQDYLFFFKDEDVIVKIGSLEYFGYNPADTKSGGTDLDQTMAYVSANSMHLAKDEKFVTLDLGGEKHTAKLILYVWD